MSTSNSVGRLTGTNEKVRLTATQENDRSAATFKVGRLTATNKKDRFRLCAFTFADGRQCRTPRCSGHQHLCYYHAKKEAEALIAKQAGEDLASLFCGKYLRAPDFAAALGRVLSAVARGYIKPKTAVSLALLVHTLNQSINVAQDEYANAPGGNARRERVVSCLMLPAPPQPPSQVAPTLQAEHPASSEPNPQSPPQPVPLQVPNHLESTLVQSV